MSEVNDEAEATRREILETRQALVFFPEGTRDNTRVRPIRGTHEIDTALRAAAEGTAVEIWPVMLRYGTRGLRPRLRIEFAEPFKADGLSAEAVAERIHAAFVATWDDVSAPAGR
jgi:1-acyl-sn-glycerol-3-phosphate acyltransferase